MPEANQVVNASGHRCILVVDVDTTNVADVVTSRFFNLQVGFAHFHDGGWEEDHFTLLACGYEPEISLADEELEAQHFFL